MLQIVMTNTIYGHWPGNSPLNVSRETNKQLTEGARGRNVKMPTYLVLQILTGAEQLDSWEV